MAYCWKDPSTVYPESLDVKQRGSSACWQKVQDRQESLSPLIPTASPILQSSSVTPGPRATQIPAPSWPPTRGSFIGRGQSPLAACRSVWQTPEYLMLMRTSPGPGVATGILLYSTGPPALSMTIAHCSLGIL